MSSTEISDQVGALQDEIIARKLKNGEPVAIKELYEAYFDRIYTMVFNQVDRDRETAQDIVQETFVAASKSWGKFDCRSKAYTWLYSIAHRKVADFYRRRKKDIKRHDKVVDNYVAASGQNGVDEALVGGSGESEAARRMIQETLSSLPMHYKEVLLLKYVEEMPVFEICQVMGKSPKSVEGLLTRARKELRDKLAMRNEG